MSYAVLIADDEQHARDYLVEMVQKEEQLELLGQCISGNQVLKFCKNLVPDILLLDIQMPGLNGIETAKKLMLLDKKPLIIFTTAFDQYAIDAFEVEAMAYLLKPFSADQFKNCIARSLVVLENLEKLNFSDRINRLWEKFNQPNEPFLKEISVKVKGLELAIPLEEILFLKSDSEYIQIHTKQKKYLQRYALTMLESQLPPSFLRIHRSVILNTSKISNWKYLQNSTFQFEMVGEDTLTSSRSFKEPIEQWLSHLDNPIG